MSMGESQPLLDVGLRELCAFFHVHNYPDVTIKQIRAASQGRCWLATRLNELFGVAASEKDLAQETVFGFYAWAEMARLNEVSLDRLVVQLDLKLENLTIQQLSSKFQEKLGC